MDKQNTYCRTHEDECSCYNCKFHKVTIPMGDLKCSIKNHYVDKGGILICNDYKPGKPL